MLSIEELRAFALANTRRGQARHASEPGEFSALALCRAIGWKHQNFYAWMHGRHDRTMPLRVQRAFSRIAQLWDAGLVEFSTERRRRLVHRDTPGPSRTRLSIDWSGAAPRVQLVPRSAPAPQMPAFRSLIRGSELTKPGQS